MIVIAFTHYNYVLPPKINIYESMDDVIFSLITFDDDTIKEFYLLDDAEKKKCTENENAACKFFATYCYEYIATQPLVVADCKSQGNTDNYNKILNHVNKWVNDYQNQHKIPIISSVVARKQKIRINIPFINKDDTTPEMKVCESINGAIEFLCKGSKWLADIFAKLSHKKQKFYTKNISNAIKFQETYDDSYVLGEVTCTTMYPPFKTYTI